MICPKCRGVFRLSDPSESEGYDAPPQPAHTYYDVEEPSSVSPRLIAFSISGALLAASAFVLLLIFAQRAGNEPRASRPDPTRSRHRRPAASRGGLQA